jgi:hypothetical protein
MVASMIWQRDSDLSRSQKIEAAGYRILRFWNNDVLGNIEGVLDEIQRVGTPTPDLSPQGGGENRPSRKVRKERRLRRNARPQAPQN